MSNSGVARKILFNTASQVVAKLVIGAISVVVLKLLTTYLGKAGYGFYKSIYEFLALFAIVADMGLYTIGVREMSKDRDSERMVLGNMMTARSVIIVLVVGLAVVASLFVPAYEGTIAPFAVAIAGLATIFAILTGTVSTALQVHLRMEWNSLGSVLGKVVSIAFMVAVIFWWFPHNCDSGVLEFLVSGGESGECEVTEAAFLQLIWAGVLGNLVMFGVTSYFANRLVRISYRFDWEFWRTVLWRSLPYGLALVLNQINFRIGSVVLLTTQGEEAVAIYGAPMTILEAAGIIPQYFANAVLPFLTRSIHNKTGGHSRIIQYSFDFLMMSAMPIVVGTLVMAYPFIALIASPEFLTDLSSGFYGSDVVLQILIVALLFSFVNGLFGYIIIAANHQDKLLTRNAVGAVIAVVMTLALVPYFVERGAALANVVTEIYITLVSYFLAKRYVKFKLKWGNSVKIVLSAVVMGLILWLVQDEVLAWTRAADSLLRLGLTVVGLVGFGALIYGVGLVVSGVLTKDLLMIVLRKKQVDE